MAVIGLIAATLLYVAAKKFYVKEDPRIAEIEALLPGANCGACGYKGCHDFSVNFVADTSPESPVCPGAGKEAMEKIASIAGIAPPANVPKVAIVRCAGSCGKRPEIAVYDGVRSCAVESATFSGETECAYGCLGLGDCAAACPYDALRIDIETHLPVVDRNKCVGCGKCVSACPHLLLELINKKESEPTVWVACRNMDKGGIAMKECEAACIGCGKCMRTCGSSAIKVADFLAYIDQEKCIGCGDCVEVCPRNSIQIYETTAS